ncbi:MAG: hypothetical protein K2I72_01265 [Bacilli bacterium]|nr:hypothetical protein [Bacilli bacterium]
METVPKMISTKDLSYLSDMFHWNFTAFKQLKHFANEVENEEIQELFQGLSEMHYQHMEWILSILRNEETEDEDEEDSEEESEEYDDDSEEEDEDDSEEDSDDESEDYDEDDEEDEEDEDSEEEDSEEEDDTDESE